MAKIPVSPLPELLCAQEGIATIYKGVCIKLFLILSNKLSSVVFKIMLKSVVNIGMYFVEVLKGID